MLNFILIVILSSNLTSPGVTQSPSLLPIQAPVISKTSKPSTLIPSSKVPQISSTKTPKGSSLPLLSVMDFLAKLAQLFIAIIIWRLAEWYYFSQLNTKFFDRLQEINKLIISNPDLEFEIYSLKKDEVISMEDLVQNAKDNPDCLTNMDENDENEKIKAETIKKYVKFRASAYIIINMADEVFSLLTTRKNLKSKLYKSWGTLTKQGLSIDLIRHFYLKEPHIWGQELVEFLIKELPEDVELQEVLRNLH